MSEEQARRPERADFSGSTLLPIIGPLIAFFLFGFPWALGLFIIQVFVFFGLGK